MWTRGVDTELFRPGPRLVRDWPRPVFMYVGRVAVEKNIEAFLALDLPGTKVVVGDGQQRAPLQRRFLSTVFTGAKSGEELAAHFRSADVFVFPSQTDTFGLVPLEAMASGTPSAAFPTTGPIDVIIPGRRASARHALFVGAGDRSVSGSSALQPCSCLTRSKARTRDSAGSAG